MPIKGGLNTWTSPEIQRASTRRQWMPWVTFCVLTLFVLGLGVMVTGPT